jgi:hypothetical protein
MRLLNAYFNEQKLNLDDALGLAISLSWLVLLDVDETIVRRFGLCLSEPVVRRTNVASYLGIRRIVDLRFSTISGHRRIPTRSIVDITHGVAFSQRMDFSSQSGLTPAAWWCGVPRLRCGTIRLYEDLTYELEALERHLLR